MYFHFNVYYGKSEKKKLNSNEKNYEEMLKLNFT